MAIVGKLTKLNLTRQPESGSCPWKYTVVATKYEDGVESGPFTFEVCIGDQGNTEDPDALQSIINDIGTTAGFPEIDFDL